MPSEQFRLLQGKDLLKVYRPASDGMSKVFCIECGSSLFGGHWPGGNEVSIRLGSLDGDPEIRPQWHTFVASKAPWDEITDDLQQFTAGPA